MELVRRANEKKAPRALYFAGAVGQRPTAAERLRSDALDKYGVDLDVVYSVVELVSHISVHTCVSPQSRRREAAAKVGQPLHASRRECRWTQSSIVSSQAHRNADRTSPV